MEFQVFVGLKGVFPIYEKQEQAEEAVISSRENCSLTKGKSEKDDKNFTPSRHALWLTVFPRHQ